MYIPIIFKVSEDTKLLGAPGVEQAYTMPSSSKVTFTTTPTISDSENKNMIGSITSNFITIAIKGSTP